MPTSSKLVKAVIYKSCTSSLNRLHLPQPSSYSFFESSKQLHGTITLNHHILNQLTLPTPPPNTQKPGRPAAE